MRQLMSDLWEVIKEPLWGFAIFVLLFVLVMAAMVQAGEREECERLAPKYHAETEVVLWDGTRVDLLSDTHAWEVDWDHKWAEAIGQSLYYAAVTSKKPGIILLVRERGKERFTYRCQTVAAKYNIELRVERVADD